MKLKQYIYFLKEYGLILAIFILPIVGFILMLILRAPAGNTQQVHWHLPLSYELCWDTTQLSDSGQHGTLHGHDDNQIHVEWIVDLEKRTETLWWFFDAAKIPFSSTTIGTYTNGDTCEWSQTPWKLSVLINGKDIPDFRNYILNDEDEIKVIFQ